MSLTQPLAVRAFAVALLAALLAVSARAEDTPSSGESPSSSKTTPTSGWAPVVFKLDAGFSISHESNLYHLEKRLYSDMATETAPFERFYRMKGPGDWEALLDLDLAWRFKHSSKRAVEIRLRARQHAFFANEIANYQDFLLETTIDLSKADSLSLVAGYSPLHFRKNYSHEAFPGISVYERADCREPDFGLAYEHEWKKKWTMGAAFRSGRRDYASPFDPRDEDKDSWSLFTRHELGKRVILRFGLERGSTRTGTSVEQGIPKDRSHDDDTLALDLDFNLRHGFSIASTIGYRVRKYTTSEPLDVSRYDRTDRRVALGFDLEKKLSPHWSVALDSAWARNESGKPAGTLDDDEFDYENLVLGLSASFRK